MSPELARTEVGLSEQAGLESDEQVRKLPELIDKASGPNPTITATDCSKLVAAALAVNERLHERTKALQSAVRTIEARSNQPQ